MQHEQESSLRRPLAPFGVALIGLLVLAVTMWASPVQAAEPAPATIKIDDSKAPTISIEARNVTVPDFLKELSSRLHFTIEGLSRLDAEQKVWVSSKGKLEDILRRVVLGETGFVAFYRGKTIDQIVIVGSHGSRNAEFPTRQADARAQSPVAPEPVPPDTPPVAASVGAALNDAATATQAPAQQGQEDTLLQTQLNLHSSFSGDGPGAPAQQSRVNSLLQTQLNQQRQFGSDGSAAPVPTALVPASASSMAALTLTARQNVLALSSALRAVCIGPNCAQ
jgi:hypothetical protein